MLESGQSAGRLTAGKRVHLLEHFFKNQIGRFLRLCLAESHHPQGPCGFDTDVNHLVFFIQKRLQIFKGHLVPIERHNDS